MWAALTVVNLGTTSSETVELKCIQIKKTPTNRELQVLLLCEPRVIGLSLPTLSLSKMLNHSLDQG